MSSTATHVRSMHWAAYRSGEWARILTLAPDPEGRDCFVVEFPDGKTDFWVKDDPDGKYEFAGVSNTERRPK